MRGPLIGFVADVPLMVRTGAIHLMHLVPRAARELLAHLPSSLTGIERKWLTQIVEEKSQEETSQYKRRNSVGKRVTWTGSAVTYQGVSFDFTGQYSLFSGLDSEFNSP